MTEIRFCSLERRRAQDALPSLLEEALAQGARVVVESPQAETIEALDERLWTYADDSFLPHGLARDGEPQTQPILLTSDADNLNGAQWRVLMDGARALPALADPCPYARLVLLFDGADPQARDAARAQWAELKAAGHAPTYWREGDSGQWEQGR